MTSKVDYNIANSEQIVGDLGRRVEAIRLSRNIRQGDLAKKSGVALRTIIRLEDGENTTIDTLVRVMLALGLGSHLDALLPDPGIRPIDRVRLQGKERQRARPKAKQEIETPFRWGDEADNSEETR